MSSIAERLAQARRGRIVGREAERALFRDALTAPEPPFLLLHVSGPGGVGKTTLLQAFRDLCAEHGAEAVALDARNVEPSPDGFLSALRGALGLPPGSDPIDALDGGKGAPGVDGGRRILFVDTYEELEGLDAWLRERFVPRLPASTLVVLAGRTPPTAGWRSDPGWRALLRSLALRNLSPDESRAYLAASHVPAEQHGAALQFTHGHPLALSLLADVYAQRGSGAGAAATVPPPLDAEAGVPADVVQDLLARLVSGVPGPAHRTALEACALVRLLDESLLFEMLDGDGPAAQAAAPELFRWLCSLSFVEKGPRGVFPHDIVRETLLADLRWRNRDRYSALHGRARAFYTARLRSAPGPEQQSMLYDCVFLHRDNAVIRAAFTWQEEQVYPDTLRPSDHNVIAAMVAQHEGEESARIARHWLTRQPEATMVFREAGSASGEPVGFLTMLGLHRAEETDQEIDPAARAALGHVTARRAPLRPGEEIAYMRFWMAREGYQGMSPVQSLIIVNALRHFLTRRLAFTFFACGDAAHWEPVFGYVEIPRLPDAAFSVGDKEYGVFGCDWRETPAASWLGRLAEKETGADPGPSPAAAETPAATPPPSGPPPLVVLSEADFREAVRDALRAYATDNALRHNPLLRSVVVVSRAGADADTASRVAALRSLLRDTAQGFAAAPKLARGYRALFHTYLQPAATQEQAAELLDLPFSTYRRHLAEGITELSTALWLQEIGDE